ncbi:MAG TPA: helicase [Paenibacillaceae bacterium]|nr:helicase [Paenibacillaceae bacterium]
MKKMMEGPIMVQGDLSLLLEVAHPLFIEAREAIALFAELVKSPEILHTYRMTPLTLWNAAALGFNGDTLITILEKYARFPVPSRVKKEILETVEKYGKLRLTKENGELYLECGEPSLLDQLLQYTSVSSILGKVKSSGKIRVPFSQRGPIKQTLLKLGYPVHDLAGFAGGEKLPISYKSDGHFSIRPYQKDSVDSFFSDGGMQGGNGVIVLPCGSGKTIVGIETMVRLGMETLILTGNNSSVSQWKGEILSFTSLNEKQVGIYTGRSKKAGPVTITTYQMLTYCNREKDYPHLDLFHRRNWGLIIYDEVHLLPAPVFRLTADLQAKRRLGLTATLIREDGREGDVFSLIGPKKFELPWRILEEKGYIAGANCREIRIPMSGDRLNKYLQSPERLKFRIASENPEKIQVIHQLLDKHEQEQILIIGQYLSQLEYLSNELNIPLITGRTSQQEREKLYYQFRKGEVHALIVSKVANYAVNLPDASVAIQVSGTYGSRQEEAQRLGRILRPKEKDNQAYFYTLVSEHSNEEVYARRRQMFLVEQGYSYEIDQYSFNEERRKTNV